MDQKTNWMIQVIGLMKPDESIEIDLGKFDHDLTVLPSPGILGS